MESLTGAALTRLVVNVAAASAGTSETMRAMSFSPLGLIPQATPAAWNPAAEVTPPPLINLASIVFVVFMPGPAFLPDRRPGWPPEWLVKHCLCQDCPGKKRAADDRCGHRPGPRSGCGWNLPPAAPR